MRGVDLLSGSTAKKSLCPIRVFARADAASTLLSDDVFDC